jgi:hypothetical protein
MEDLTIETILTPVPFIPFTLQFFIIILVYVGVVLSADSYGPEFIRPLPASLTFTNNTGGVVACQVAGEPRPLTSWVLKEGAAPLPPAPDLLAVHPNGTLEFFRYVQYVLYTS